MGNNYVRNVVESVRAKYPHQPEFLQAVREVFESLELVVSPSVPDLTPLASLTKLEELDITMEGSGAYGYSDISALYGLTELRSLRIRTYGLATLEGIQNLVLFCLILQVVHLFCKSPPHYCDIPKYNMAQ